VPGLSTLRRRLQPYIELELPLVAQIMGNDSGRLAETAARLASLGLAGVDLNCACPSPTVLRNGSGGSLLRRPGWIRDTLAAMRRACPKTGITVKLRAGFSDPTELDAVLAAVAEAVPDAVALHRRTVAEMYEPAAEHTWDRVKHARTILPRQTALLASGDLFDCRDARRCWQQTGADGLLLARGLLQDPWLLTRLVNGCRGREPSPTSDARKLQFLMALASSAAQTEKDRNYGFIIYHARMLFGARHPLTGRLMNCRSLPQCRACIARRLGT
jgi:tRNA-dihydrouridine synthase